MQTKFNRFCELSLDERNALVEAAKSGRRFTSFTLKLWQNYGKSRLYIESIEQYMKRSMSKVSEFFDLQNPNDLSIDNAQIWAAELEAFFAEVFAPVAAPVAELVVAPVAEPNYSEVPNPPAATAPSITTDEDDPEYSKYTSDPAWIEATAQYVAARNEAERWRKYEKGFFGDLHEDGELFQSLIDGYQEKTLSPKQKKVFLAVDARRMAGSRELKEATTKLFAALDARLDARGAAIKAADAGGSIDADKTSADQDDQDDLARLDNAPVDVREIAQDLGISWHDALSRIKSGEIPGGYRDNRGYWSVKANDWRAYYHSWLLSQMA